MNEIQNQIKQIISIRKERRLPEIERELAFVDNLLHRIDSLDRLVKEIKEQCALKKGPYYTILANDQGMEIRLSNVSTSDVRTALENMREELLRLRMRFSRKSISLQVFGMAGSGKSTFIQSVTGLGNDVVLASEGGHCTGVSSFIYNSDHFETRVYLYSEAELLDLFNKNLEALEKKFDPTAPSKLLSVFEQIASFTMESVGLPATMDGRLSVMKYVDNYPLIRNLISGLDKEGRPIVGLNMDADGHRYISITDATQVQPWIAQHNGHHASDPNYVAYMNYLAVNRVEIFQEFQCKDAGDIVLMDNVGLGDASNDISTEQHMYQAIADNSDAVILLYQPKPNSGWRGEEEAINTRLNNIRFKNVYQGEERMDVHELYFLLNQRHTSGFDNSKDCPEVVKAFRSQPYERKETILVANAIDSESTRKDAVEPILHQLMEHLDDIDVRMVEHANELGQTLYVTYKTLVDAVTAVISGSMKQGSNELKKFHSLYNSTLDFSEQIRILERKYIQDKDKPCVEVKNRMEEVISGLTKLISKPEAILVDIRKGRDATNSIFEKHVKLFRNSIYAAFHNVNMDVLVPLQNKVTDSLIGILFHNAKLGNIPLVDYAVEDGSSQEWLRTFMQEKVDRNVYPKLHDILRFVLNYDLSIEGLIKYNVACCLNTLDPNDAAFRTMNPITGVSDEIHAKKIWSEIVSRTSTIQVNMRKWRDDFSLIPSHSFYAQISMVRDMIVEDAELDEELYGFYSENRMSVWREEFAFMIQETEAFGRWNEESKAITDLCTKNAFTIKLNIN